jgi:hypothetical protein
VLLAFAPLIWVELLPRARAHYQRHGEVIESEKGWNGRRAFLGFALVFAVLTPAELVKHQLGWAVETGRVACVGLVAAVVAVLVAAARAKRNTRGTYDALMTVVLPGCVAGAISAGRVYPTFWTVFLLTFGGTLIAEGMYGHIVFRRLERRLTALKGSA